MKDEQTFLGEQKKICNKCNMHLCWETQCKIGGKVGSPVSSLFSISHYSTFSSIVF